MGAVESGSAKFILVVALVLLFVFLFVAVENQIFRLVVGFALLVSLSLLISDMFLKRKKKTVAISMSTIGKERKSLETIEEGFIVKKVEQTTPNLSGKCSPREEFKALLKLILSLIKNNIFANSVAFYWSNEDKRQMVFEDGVTDLNYIFVRRYNWDDDALSISAKSGQYKVFGDLNSSASEDTIKYQNPKVGSKSLLVYPVSYKGKVVGVIVLDSMQAQTFSDDDVKNLSLFSDLIAQLIEIYSTKLDLYYKSRILEIITDLEPFKFEDLFTKIQNFAIKILDCSAVAVVLFENGKWVVSFEYSKLGRYVEPGTEVKIDGTLVGEAIATGISKVIPSTRTYGKVFRFSDAEKINLESSIAVIPIRYGKKCYGALVFEHPKHNFFSSHSDIKNLEDLSSIVGLLLENISLNELVENYFVFEENSYLMKKHYLYLRLDEEIERKIRHGGELSLVLIRVDNVDYIRTTYGEDAANLIQPYVASTIREHLNKYDLLGKVEDNLIGVVLVETGPNEAYIWAEKLRKLISSQAIKYRDRSFAVTITAGISAWDGERNAREFIDRVKRGFLRVIQSNENIVKVF